MRLRRLEIKNLRGIQEIELRTKKTINVITGPNAVGKTTILEAVRLAKGILCPRYPQEGQQILQSLGALSPHFAFLGNRGFDYSSLANESEKDLEINIDFEFNFQEIETLKHSLEPISLSILQSRVSRPEEGVQFQLSQFLSTNEGGEALKKARDDVRGVLSSYEPAKLVSIRMKVPAGSETFSGNDIYAQIAIATLERILVPQYAKFSYFPADRAFPQGEVSMQLGSADAQNQIQAHLGIPGSKYGRVKIALTQGFIFGSLSKEDIKREFESIFDFLLPGKKFSNIIMSPSGVMKVMVEDTVKKKIFDIDNLSSGEKGLLSIFLLINLSVAPGGIIMLDEPELHLNPTVTRNLLGYIHSQATTRDLQVFICTHSPEILGDAYDMDECSLFYLRSGTDLSPVYRQDESAVLEILDRLGASTADVLFSKGNIFVEGDHDDEILGEGFSAIVSGYKITQMGGRSEIEKAIKSLEENPGSLDRPQLFLFDNDRKPSDLNGRGSVVVMQWQRYCLENYLLDDKPLYDIVNEFAQVKPVSRGEFLMNLKADAISQIDGYVIRKIYADLEPPNAGLRSQEIKGKSISETIEILANRLDEIKTKMITFDKENWISKFYSLVETKKQELIVDWENNWRTEANGKALIDALYKRYQIRSEKLKFKKSVIRAMRQEQTETWRAVAGILSDALGASKTN